MANKTKVLPNYFKQILWFSDFKKVSLEKDWQMILFQALEKGRMEHLDYLFKKLGSIKIMKFAKNNAKRFSRKSIMPFIKALSVK